MDIVSVNQLISDFRSADFKAYVESNPLHDLAFPEYFKNEFTPELTWANIESSSNAKIMAPVVALDADVQLKGRDSFASVKGELPKIEVGRKMTERDFFKLRGLQNALAVNRSNSGIQAQLINTMYGDGRFVVDSVNARLEYMAKQLFSTGKYTAQNGIVVDFGIRVENATKDWFKANVTATGYDPIADVKKLQKIAMAKGYRFTQMVMDAETFDKFVEAESVIKLAASFGQLALGLQSTPNLEQVNKALQQKQLPTIKVWDSFIADEKMNGDLEAVSAWERGNILFNATPDYGSIKYTVSPEATINLNETAKFITNEYTLVSVLGQAKPMSVITVGMAFATPVLNNTNKKIILKTKLS